MKAARFYGKGNMVVEEIPVREPEEREVLIRVKFCGICGTDIHIFGGDKGASEVTPPVTLGHEFSGEVVKTGSAVERFKPGDRVSVDPNSYCGKCYHCSRGKKHLCSSMEGYGTTKDGGFAEYVTVHENQVYKIPDHVSYESAALSEPLSCCLRGLDLTEIQAGDTVMVVGCGGIGLIMVQLAKYSGAARIIAVEPNGEKRRTACELGADFSIDPLHDDTDAVLQEHGIVCIDRVIDCAGLVSTNEYSVHHAGRGATVMLYGLTPPDAEMKLKPFEVFEKELTIRGSFCNPDTFSRAIDLLDGERVQMDSIITGIYDLDRISEVFEQRLFAKNTKTLIRCS